MSNDLTKYISELNKIGKAYLMDYAKDNQHMVERLQSDIECWGYAVLAKCTTRPTFAYEFDKVKEIYKEVLEQYFANTYNSGFGYKIEKTVYQRLEESYENHFGKVSSLN